jgi:hypothetical protein
MDLIVGIRKAGEPSGFVPLAGSDVNADACSTGSKTVISVAATSE